MRVLSSCIAVQDTARDLGVIIDSQLSLSAHVTAVCRSGYYQLRQAVRLLSEDASKTLVQVFVSCRMDYCNSLFFGISEGLMNRLQSVQNAAARLVTSTQRSVSYTGYQCASASTSRWPRSSTSRCLAFRHHTWPTTAALSPMFVSSGCIQQRAEHAL